MRVDHFTLGICKEFIIVKNGWKKIKVSHFAKLMRWGTMTHGAFLEPKNNVAVITDNKACPRGKTSSVKFDALGALFVDQRSHPRR